MRPISRRSLGRFGKLAIASMAMTLPGCNPAGTGSVDVAKPEEVRAKREGEPASSKPLSVKQAKAQEIEAEAAKKNPKLR